MQWRLSERPKDAWMYVLSRLSVYVDLSTACRDKAAVSMGTCRGLLEYQDGVFTLTCRGGVVEAVRGVVSDTLEVVMSSGYPGVTVTKHVKRGSEHWERVPGTVTSSMTSGVGLTDSGTGVPLIISMMHDLQCLCSSSG